MKRNGYFLFGFGFGLGTGIGLVQVRKREKKHREQSALIERIEERVRTSAEVAEETAVENDEKKGPDILEYMAKKRFEEERRSYLDMLGKYRQETPEETAREGVEIEDPPARIEPTPYVITPHEYGEREGYDTIGYTFFDDGVLADENGEEMSREEIENTVGLGAVTHFGEYEEDSVYIRNERHRCDYEILLDERDYEEFLETRPKPILMEEV